MVEIIKTITGYSRAHGLIKTTVGSAYRCKVCGLITLSKKEAIPHLKCKETTK
jgi:hypothetical protein